MHWEEPDAAAIVSCQTLLTDGSTLLCGKPCVIDTLSLAVRYHFGVLKSQHFLWKEEKGTVVQESLAVSGEVRAVQCAAAVVTVQVSFLLIPPFNIHEPGGVFI